MSLLLKMVSQYFRDSTSSNIFQDGKVCLHKQSKYCIVGRSLERLRYSQIRFMIIRGYDDFKFCLNHCYILSYDSEGVHGFTQFVLLVPHFRLIIKPSLGFEYDETRNCSL